MVGNGIQSKNVFAALDSLRKKKKSDSTKSKGSSKVTTQGKEKEPQVFWQPAKLTGTSWADVDDDDDYYATTAPPQAAWAIEEPQQKSESPALVDEETESEIDYGDEDIEDEPEPEPEVISPVESIIKKSVQLLPPPKETERHLSKKELKKKELAELEAVLAEFGITEKQTNNVTHESHEEKRLKQLGDTIKKENMSNPIESKTSKKKKKKEKSTKEKDSQEQGDGPVEATGRGPAEEEDTSVVDAKERLKKMASSKKKKSSKEMDTAARAAALEAAARSAKLAAAKKKEKNHYNQQPVR